MSLELSDTIDQVTGIGDKTTAILSNSGIFSVYDLLQHYPKKHLEFTATTTTSLEVGDLVILHGQLSKPFSQRKSHITTQSSTFKDNSGNITIRWFNQPYLARSIRPNTDYILKGMVTEFAGRLQIVNPQLTKSDTPLPSEIMPIYPAIGSIKSSAITKKVRTILDSTTIPDPLPSTIRTKYNLIDKTTAIHNIHFPDDYDILEQSIYRLSFEELFDLQRSIHLTKPQQIKSQHLIKPDHQPIKTLINSLTFQLTQSQLTSYQEILDDLANPHYMHRLLQGNVGSGKTIVATIAAYATVLSGHKVYIMAPTQILATQLQEAIDAFLATYNITTQLITGTVKPSGDFDILVGTHALLELDEREDIGLVIIDEQHKFGVKQRELLNSLAQHSHILNMTATPIPRTLALTVFGHQDISYLKDMPTNRIPIKTYLVKETKRQDSYNWIKNLIDKNNYQVFVVAPLIEESEYLPMKHLRSVGDIHAELKKAFPKYKIDLIHGRLKDKTKNSKLKAFKEGKINILVSTTVIEVGIDVPEANVIIIESSERFGLSQLHQLRGRVGRSHKQGYCLLFTSSYSPKSQQRLQTFTQHTDGSRLAQMDMQLRGPGELQGTLQHGFLNLRLANIFDTELLATTQQALKDSLANKPNPD